jgi:membrane protein DedA with SNARE-associated domain
LRGVFSGVAGMLVSWGPPGVFLLALLDSGGIPIPAGVDVLIVAVAARSAPAGLLCAGLAAAGSALGCLFLFHLGRKGGEAYVDRKARGHSRGARFRLWFHRYGLLTVFVPALVPAPLPTKVFVLLAGAMKVRRAAFLVVVLAARLPRYFGLAWLGWQWGARPAELFRDHGWALAAAAAGLFLALAGLLNLAARRRGRVTMAGASNVEGNPS